jgi:hypothetical protein
MVTNLILIACALVFIAAAAFRIWGMGRRNSGAEEDQVEGLDGEFVDETVDGSPGYGGANPPSTRVEGGAGEEPVLIDVKELFTRIAQEEPEAVMSSAGAMVEHLRERGGSTGASPENLERLAMQFGLIEMALRRASYDQTGASCVIPGEMMSEIMREGFRLVSSKARD